MLRNQEEIICRRGKATAELTLQIHLMTNKELIKIVYITHAMNNNSNCNITIISISKAAKTHNTEY